MKVIFLDIDGVLNNSHTRTTTRDGWCFVDDELVANLKKVVDATDAKIVLSSTWRDGWHWEDESLNDISFIDLRKKFQEFGMRISSKTGDWKKNRGLEIEEWLNNWKGESIESFIIIDDWSDIGPFKDHLLQTNPKFGFTETDAELAICFLNN